MLLQALKIPAIMYNLYHRTVMMVAMVLMPGKKLQEGWRDDAAGRLLPRASTLASSFTLTSPPTPRPLPFLAGDGVSPTSYGNVVCTATERLRGWCPLMSTFSLNTPPINRFKAELQSFTYKA